MGTMAIAIADTVGENRVAPPLVTPGGKYFHYYTLKRPSAKATMLGLGYGLSPGLHHPQMTLNPDSILTGIEILVGVVQGTFERIEEEQE